MKLDVETLREKCPEYATIACLSCPHLHLSSVSSLSYCQQLRCISLRFNSITSIAPLQHCRLLWRLDLRNNRLSDISPLSSFAALGTVLLTSNPVSLAALRKLRPVHLLTLEVSLPEMHTAQKRELLPRMDYGRCLDAQWRVYARKRSRQEGLSSMCRTAYWRTGGKGNSGRWTLRPARTNKGKANRAVGGLDALEGYYRPHCVFTPLSPSSFP